MSGWLLVKVSHTVTLVEVAACFLVSDSGTVKSSDCTCATVCIKNTVLVPEPLQTMGKEKAESCIMEYELFI